MNKCEPRSQLPPPPPPPPNTNGSLWRRARLKLGRSCARQASRHVRGKFTSTKKDQPCRKERRKRKRTGAVEASLAELPLYGGGVLGPLAATAMSHCWKSALYDVERRSFVSHLSGAFPKEVCREWWRLLSRDLAWERPSVGGKPLPRKAVWLTPRGCTCTYQYAGTRWPATVMEPWFLEITERVCRACGLSKLPNSCNANYYEDGTQSVGWHSDDEPLFASTRCDALIISLSLGTARSFELKRNGAKKPSLRLFLGDGDLCTMEGLTQKHYRHRVPPEKKGKCEGARINLTWRWIVEHSRTCPQRACGGGAQCERRLSQTNLSCSSAADHLDPPLPPLPPPTVPMLAAPLAPPAPAALPVASHRTALLPPAPPAPPAPSVLVQLPAVSSPVPPDHPPPKHLLEAVPISGAVGQASIETTQGATLDSANLQLEGETPKAQCFGPPVYMRPRTDPTASSATASSERSGRSAETFAGRSSVDIISRVGGYSKEERSPRYCSAGIRMCLPRCFEMPVSCMCPVVGVS